MTAYPFICSGCKSRFDGGSIEPQDGRFISTEYPLVCTVCWDLWHILTALDQKNGKPYWTSLQWAYEAEKRARGDK